MDFWDLLFGTPVKSFLLLSPHQCQKQTYALAYSFHLVMLGSIDLYAVYLLMIALFYICISLYICFYFFFACVLIQRFCTLSEDVQ